MKSHGVIQSNTREIKFPRLTVSNTDIFRMYVRKCHKFLFFTESRPSNPQGNNNIPPNNENPHPPPPYVITGDGRYISYVQRPVSRPDFGYQAFIQEKIPGTNKVKLTTMHSNGAESSRVYETPQRGNRRLPFELPNHLAYKEDNQKQ